MLLLKLDKASREPLSQLLEEKNQSQRAGAMLQHVPAHGVARCAAPRAQAGVRGMNRINLQA